MSSRFGMIMQYAIALGAALAAAGLIVAGAYGGHPGLAMPAVAVLVISIILMGAAARRQALLAIRQESDQLVRLLGSARDEDFLHSAEAPVELRFGLDRVAGAFDAAIASGQRRSNELAARCREVELQARITEAERRRIASILDTLTDAVIVTDTFNELALANRAAAHVLHFDLQPSLRRPIDQVVNEPSLIKQIKDMREVRDSPLRRHFEHRLLDDGREAVFDVTMSCLGAAGAAQANSGNDPGGANGSVVTILRNITREKEVSRMKSEFVSSVSHELRTPLASIKAYVEMLVDGEAGDEEIRMEFYNIIQGEANRLSRLIDNILNISRIESGIIKVHRERIGLLGIIREAVEIMQPQARAKRIGLTEQTTGFDCYVIVDRDMILQSVLNLVSNAVKYTPEGGGVRVGFDKDDARRRVSVWVADTGVGIPPDDLPHLFEKFYRVGRHTGLAKGTGLGLNLVRHVIETVHAGNIHVESQIDKGSTFTFSLPIAEK